LVDWLGYPQSDPDTDDGWVKLPDCHWCQPIKDYIDAHRLQRAVNARKHALGPLPRS
jgi:hypothetical protein